MSTANVFSETSGSRGGGIRAAIDTMVRETVRAHEERARREAVARLIRVTDAMIAEAEELNLREEPRISDQLRMRAELVFELLGFEIVPAFRLEPTPTLLIDALFDALQILFDLKAGADSEEPAWLPGQPAGGTGSITARSDISAVTLRYPRD